MQHWGVWFNSLEKWLQTMTNVAYTPCFISVFVPLMEDFFKAENSYLP